MRKVRITESQLKGLVRGMIREEKKRIKEGFAYGGMSFIGEIQDALDQSKPLEVLISSVEAICDKYREFN
jgi:hypothetical protein